MSNLRYTRQTYDVFVGNLPNPVNKKLITQKFSAYGEIQQVTFRVDRNTNIYYGIFKYLCEPDAQRAVQECHKQEWEGIVLTVNHDRKTHNKKDWQSKKTQKQEYPIKNWSPSVLNDAPNNMFQIPQNSLLGSPPNDVAKQPYQASQYASFKDKSPSQQQMIEFLCTNVESVTTFHGNLISKINEVTDIQSNLQHQCATLSHNTDIPDNGEVYASQFSEDQIWYRCIVRNNIIPSKPGMCTVNYIDYGNSEDIRYEQLVKLPKSMKAPPPLAVKCVLNNLEVCAKKKQEGLKFLQEMLFGQRFFVESSSPSGAVIPVTRCISNDIDIFEQLITEGFVVSTLVNQQPQLVTIQSDSNSQQVDQLTKPNYRAAHNPTSEFGVGIPSPVIPAPNIANAKPFGNTRFPYGGGMPYSEPLYNNAGPKSLDTKAQFKFTQKPFPSNGSMSSSGSDIMNKLGFSNSSQQRPVRASSAFIFPKQCSKPTVINKPFQKNGSFDSKPKDKNVVSPNIQILQRNSSSEASGSQEVAKLMSERDAIKKQLMEQYEHVKELKSEINGLQMELDQNSINRKIDNIISSLKLVNHIRHSVSSSTIQNFIESTLERLKSEFKNLIDSKNKREELESAFAVHAQSLENIKACTDKTDLPRLIEEKNKLSEALRTTLERYLNHYEKELQHTNTFIKAITADLQRNSNMYADISLAKVPNSVDELIADYQHVWKKKQESVNTIKHATNEAHRNLMFLFSELQKKFSLHEATSFQTLLHSENEPSNAVCGDDEDNLNCSAKFNNALLLLKDALLKEIAAYALNNEGKPGTSIIQLILSTIDSLEKEVQKNSTFYKKYSSIYKELNITSNVESTIYKVGITKNKIKSVKSKLRHKLADKKDIEENEEDNSESLAKLDAEISSLQHELHSLFLDEDSVKKTLAVAYESNYPEITLEYPDLNLLKYSQYHYLVKHGWEPEHFTLRKLQNKLGIEYESKFLDESVIIKEFVLESDDKINEFIASVKEWNCVKSNFLVDIRALFLKNERIMYVLVPCVGQSIINNTSHFDECRRRFLLYKVLNGLYDLHSSGLIHGALNPHAVLCNEDNIVLDFFFDIKYKPGLSEFKNLSFHANDSRKTQSSDMYSFGCLLLWVLFPSLPGFDDFRTSGASGFQSLLKKTLSDTEQDILHALLDNNPENRPTAKQLLEGDFLKNVSEFPSYSVPQIAPDPFTKDIKYDITEDKIYPPQDSNPAMTLIAESSREDLCTPDEDSTSSQEEDAANDILGSLHALREPVGATIGFSNDDLPQSDKVITPTNNNIIDTSSVTNIDYDNRTNLEESDSECDIVNLNSLRDSLGEAMSIDRLNDPSSNEHSETSEDSLPGMINTVIPEPGSAYDKTLGISGKFSKAAASSAEQNFEFKTAKASPEDIVCDSGSEIVTSKEKLGAQLMSEVFIHDKDEILVTDEELHMLDYGGSNDPTPENRSRASSDC